MARILLVAYDNDSYIHWFPQGLAYIASSLLRAGHEVDIHQQDTNHYPDSVLTDRLSKINYDIVATGMCGGYWQYKKLLDISESVKKAKHNNKPFFVVGGHLVSPEPEYFLRKTCADAIVIGEGEETFSELVYSIEHKSPLDNVKGIAFKRKTRIGGHWGIVTIITKKRPLIKDIDSIPMPAYHLFDINSYRLLRMPHCSNKDFVMPVLSGRGCTFKCNFCYRMDEGFRPRGHESIIKEIKYLQRNYGITYIAFSDELLMSSKKRTIELCNAFIESGLKFKWDCNGRLNYATPEVLQLMKEAGCVFINYGIESVDDTVLKNMHKNLTVKQITKGVENTLDAGISPGLNIIWGNIGDTAETLQKGVKFLNDYSDDVQMRTIRPVTPYPGCELWYYALESGLIKNIEDFYENKHINSDLMSVNFTPYTDEMFHRLLYNANSLLISEHFERKIIDYQTQAFNLYHGKNKDFRGFRQS